MRRLTKIILTLLVLTLILVPLTMMASAATGGFTTSPNLPDNQNPDVSGFFDIRVIPGDRQRISINVGNPGNEDITVEINLLTVGTNMNGIVDYSTQGLADETMLHPFADIASSPVQETELTVPAGYSAEVPIYIDVPEEGFDGIILGAIHVLRGISEEERAEAGMFINRFAQVVIVRLQENYTPIETDFVLGSLGLETVHHRAAIVAEIRNPRPRMSVGAVVNAEIYFEDQESPIFVVSNMNVDFAPNSVFSLSMIDSAGYGVLPGDYTAVITLDHDGQTWVFEEFFTVEAAHAEAVNLAAVNQQQAPQLPGGGGSGGGSPGGIPIWAFIAVGATLLAIIAVLIAKSGAAKKKQEQSTKEDQVQSENFSE